jgi:hypothetical protein
MKIHKDEIIIAHDFLKKDRAAREKWIMETEQEDIEQLILIRKRAIESGELADVIYKALQEHVNYLASKNPSSLTRDETEVLMKIGAEMSKRKSK